MSTGRKILLSALIAAAAAASLGAGVFATFNASTRNAGNLFANGTLVLSNTKQGGTACLSTGGGSTDTNANNACPQLFDLTVRKPGDEGSANLTIKNEGSIPASVLEVFSTACTDADVPGEAYNGTGSPCSKVQLTIQQYADAGFSTPSSCIYGGGTATTCDFSDTSKTLAAFQAAHNSPSNGLSIGSGLPSGSAAYFKVAVRLPADADNSFQGRQATIDFNWYAQQ